MRLLRLAACCVLGLLQVTPTQAQDEQTKQLQQLQKSIDSIKRELGTTRQQRSTVAAQLQQLETDISAVQQSLQELTTRINGSEQELDSLQQQAATLDARRAEQLAHIRRYVQSAYRSGRASTLKLLLGQSDPARSSRMLRYYRHLSEARLAHIADFRATLTAMTAVSTDISATSTELAAQQAALLETQARLLERQRERQTLLDDLDVELQTGNTELATLERERAELERLLEELRNTIAELDAGGADTPFAERKGQLPWPTDGRLLHAFGSRHELGDLTREGVTLGAAAGTAVQAVHHGRVVFADWLGNSGQLLIIDHGDGFMTLYAHNQELLKSEGDWVAAGETVATVGNTGGQRDSALYFEIRRNGKAEDPVNWCVPRR